MQKLLTVIVMLFFSMTLPAQTVKPIAAKVQQAHQTVPVFRSVTLFGAATSNLDAAPSVKAGVEAGILLSWDEEAVKSLRLHGDRPVNILLPKGDGTNMTLELIPAKGLSNDFEVRIASDGFSRSVQVDKGTHYWGIVDGDPFTTAVISVFDHEIAGLIATQNEQYTLGLIDDSGDKTHILYKNDRLKGANPFECGADGDEFQIGTLEGEGVARATSGPDNCVRMFIEADYTLFQNKGSVANVTSYMAAVFTQVSALYANEAINLNMHSLYVWDVTDPYTGPSASNYLTQFRTAKNGVFNGDLAHLVGIHGLGGVAYVDVLCFPSYGVGYSSINASFSNVPVYSWTVEVLTHEIGHNLGSSHTHACVWNGNNTAIDGCGPTYNSGYAEGSCPTGPLPTNGGTVMSYCHLLSGVGINFNNGFGPQPGDKIRNEVYNASCLSSCGVVTIPNAPTNLAATAVSAAQINLTWVDNATDETSYKVERATSATGPWTEIASSLAANTTSYSATGLTASTTYYFQVRAGNSAGNSGYSNTANATTQSNTINAPTNLSATATSTTQIALSWTDNATNETAYKVERATSSAGPWTQVTGTLAANTTSYNSTGLTAGTTYYFQVRAANTTTNSPYSGIASATTLIPVPAKPTGLAATLISPTQINLTWTDVATEDFYQVDIAPASSGPWTNLEAALPANTTAYSATGLSEATLYYFRIRAGNSGGYSAYSSTVNKTTYPHAPTNLSAAPVSATSVSLTWTDNSSVETVYKVERTTNPAGTWTSVTSSLAANTTAYTVTGLTASTTYYFRVRAAKSSNNSLYSNNATAATLIAAPAKPTGLAATIVSSTQINLTWTDVATEDTYQLEQATASAGPWTVVGAGLPANTTSFAATGLNEATTYYFRISASNAGGTSAYSSTVNKTTYPHAPTNLTATPTAYNKVLLTWTDNSSVETVYKVERTTNPAGTWTSVTSSLAANTTSYTATGLSANTTYYFRVRAAKSTNNSLYSDQATATTPASLGNDDAEERSYVPVGAVAENIPVSVSALTSAPNPANEGFHLVFQADRTGAAQLMVFDRIGQVTMRKTITAIPGENKLWIASGEWNSGLYVIALTSGQQTLTHKVLISKR